MYNQFSQYLDELDISFTFKENDAWFGPAIYATSLETCSWVGLSYPFFNETEFLNWPIFHFKYVWTQNNFCPSIPRNFFYLSYSGPSDGHENTTYFPVTTNPVIVKADVTEVGTTVVMFFICFIYVVNLSMAYTDTVHAWCLANMYVIVQCMFIVKIFLWSRWTVKI